MEYKFQSVVFIEITHRLYSIPKYRTYAKLMSESVSAIYTEGIRTKTNSVLDVFQGRFCIHRVSLCHAQYI